jgi:hypothetical protein
MLPKSVEICRFLRIWLTPTALVLSALEKGCKRRLICLGCHSVVAPSTLDSKSYLLDFDGPITFDSRSGVRV